MRNFIHPIIYHISFHQAHFPDKLQNMQFLHQRLHQLGARKMVFHGLGPLGCIPSQRVKSKRRICLKQVNLWVQEFNSKVQKLVNNLNGHLPSAQITFADTYQDVMDLIENPTAYGNSTFQITPFMFIPQVDLVIVTIILFCNISDLTRF